MADKTAFAGAVDGGVRQILRLEGLLLLGAASALFWRSGGDWRLFAALFLVPDISLAFYLAGPRAGAAAYNAMHATIGPLLLAAAGFACGQPLALAIACIWFAHVGFDRALGYGLKHTRGFAFTHLGRIGRMPKEN